VGHTLNLWGKKPGFFLGQDGFSVKKSRISLPQKKIADKENPTFS